MDIRNNVPMITLLVSVLGLGVLILVASIFWIDAAPTIYQHIGGIDEPSNDMAWGIIWFIGLTGILLLFPVRYWFRVDIVILWVIHGFVAIVFVGMLEQSAEYMDQYIYWIRTGDPHQRSPGLLFGLGTEATNNTRLLIQAHRFLLPDSYQLTKVSFAFVKFMGVLLVYRSVVGLSGRESRLVLWLIGLIPSVILWSGMIGKDSLNMLAIGLYLYGMVKVINGMRGIGSLSILGAFILVVLIRPWYLPIFSAGILVFILSRPVRRGSLSLSKIGSVIAVGIAGCVLLWRMGGLGIALNPNLIVTELGRLQSGFATGGSAVGGAPASSIGGVLASLPWTSFTALYRPLPGEVLSVFGLLAGLESAIMLGFGVRTVFLMVKHRVAIGRVEFWLLVVVITWAVFFGLTAAGNLGSLSRYRGPILPVMIMLWYLIEINVTRISLHRKAQVSD